MMRMLTAYQRMNARYPTAVQAATASGIACAGDIVMQTIERKQTGAEFDWARTGRFALFRLVIFGPAYSVWMRVLDRPTIRWPVKILLDQLLWTPPSLTSFYVCMACLEGNELRVGLDRARSLLWTTLQAHARHHLGPPTAPPPTCDLCGPHGA